jgi:hypothetical protein
MERERERGRLTLLPRKYRVPKNRFILGMEEEEED